MAYTHWQVTPTSLLIATLVAVTPKIPELNLPVGLQAEPPLSDETVETLVREVEDISAPLGVRWM